jgi:hypothetical protein
MINSQMKNHTGSIIAQDEEDRVAVLRTRDYNDKSATESEKISMIGRNHVRIGTWNERRRRNFKSGGTKPNSRAERAKHSFSTPFHKYEGTNKQTSHEHLSA